MPIYQINHETTYDYRQPVLYSHHLAHMLPRTVCRQNWISHNIEVEPNPTIQQERLDIYGNKVLAFSIEQEHTHFRFKTTGIRCSNVRLRLSFRKVRRIRPQLRTGKFRAEPPDFRRRIRTNDENLYGLQIHAGSNENRSSATRNFARPKRSLSGFCTLDDWLFAIAAPPLPLRERISANAPT